jgi:hypothetical protein
MAAQHVGRLENEAIGASLDHAEHRAAEDLGGREQPGRDAEGRGIARKSGLRSTMPIR